MTTLVLERDPIAVDVHASDDELIVRLADGRSVVVPVEWFPRLAHGTPAERNNYEILGHGTAIGWPDLDEHVSVEGILAGRPSGESPESLKRWLAARPQRSS